MVSKKHPAQEGLRVTLHIGATKTGSSALQKLLFTNRDALQRSSVLYPEVGVASNAHHILLGAIHPGAWRLHKDAYDVSRPEYFLRSVEQLFERARKTDCRHLVLSSEYLWGEFNPLVYKQVRDAFAGSRIRIFACTREPTRWQEASYLQAVKSGERRYFPKWKAETSRQPQRGFDFDSVLKKWAEGVDAVSTTVVPYEFTSTDEFMKQVFFKMTNVELGEIPARKLAGIVNQSPTSEGLRKILELNRSEIPQSERQKKLREILRYHSRPPNTQKLFFPKESDFSANGTE